jgi:NAD(P)H-flavin reductase
MNDVTKGLLEALKAAQAYVCGPTAWTQEQEDTLVEAMSKAIAEAEAKQAGPARLTDEVIERLWYSSRGISTLFARAIETSILERNGFNPQAKGD